MHEARPAQLERPRSASVRPARRRPRRHVGALSRLLIPLIAALAVGVLLFPLHVFVALGVLALTVGFVKGLTSPVWAVGLFVAVLPVSLNQSFALGPVDVIHVTGAAVVGLVVMQRVLTGQAPLRWHPSARWAVVLVVLVLVASAAALDPLVALRQAMALAIGVALALAVNAACARSSDLRRILVVLVVVSAAVCLSTLGNAGAIETVVGNPGAVENRAVGIFQSPNQLGTFSGVLVFVGLGLAFGSRTRLETTLGALGALSGAAALALSLSRGAWIGAVLALIVLLAFSPKARRVVPAALLIAALVVPFTLAREAPELWSVLRQRAIAMADMKSHPYDARDLIWHEARRQIAERPLVGQGPATFSLASHDPESPAIAVNALHAHNVLLNVAAEAGIPAVATLVALTISSARAVLRARSRVPRRDWEILIGVSCSLILVAGQGLVDYTVGNPALLFLAWMLLGVLFAATTPRDPSSTAEAAGGAVGMSQVPLVSPRPRRSA